MSNFKPPLIFSPCLSSLFPSVVSASRFSLKSEVVTLVVPVVSWDPKGETNKQQQQNKKRSLQGQPFEQP